MANQLNLVFALLFLGVIFVSAAWSPLQIKSERGIPKHGNTGKPNHRKSSIPTHPNQINPSFRLPITVVPESYFVRLMPILDELPPNDAGNYETFTAPGFVQIDVTCVVPGNTITLHVHPMLRVNESFASVTHQFVPIAITEQTFDEDRHFYTLTLETPLQVRSDYQITLHFVARISREGDRMAWMYGLYSSYYVKPGSTDRTYLATTQMQPVSARQMFPSFDEPHLKATFTISIQRSGKYHALSNSKLNTTEPIDEQPGWFEDEFETTEKMSTYLVALVVSDFNYTEAASDLYRLPVRIYAAPHLIDDGGGVFAAETAANQMAYFEREFELNYTMKKIDSVAVAHFAAGAMENWGLNIYRPEYLLHFDGKTREWYRGLVSNVVAHELAHQWFGNLVTCQWWSELWLNEGFATYLSYKGWEETHPEFEPQKFFINDAFQYSMLVDGNPSRTHPLVNDAFTPKEIDSYFDGITYEKGGSLIRMMEGFLGYEVLREGLVLYLKDMSYKAATQNDLFRNLNIRAQEDNLLPEGGVTVQDVMETWTLQSAFPLVRVSKFTSESVLISQERFIPSLYRVENILDTNNMWYIPIGVVSESSNNFSDHKPTFWLGKSTAAKVFPHDTTTWIMINPDATGYYRVLYDPPLTELIKEQLEMTNFENSTISPLSRSQLFDDYFNLAANDYISIESALELTKYLSRENERIVWEAVLGSLEDILNRLSDSAAFDSFRRYLSPKFSSVLSKIGIRQPLPPTTEKGAIIILRAMLLDWASQMDLPEVTAYANDLFEEWKNSTELEIVPFPVDIRAVIYCTGVRIVDQGGENFEFMFERYQNEMDPPAKASFLRSLGCSRDVALLQSALDEILATPSRIDEADKAIALQIFAGSNSLGRSLTTKFIRENAMALYLQFDNSTMEIVDAVDTLSFGMDSDGELNEIKALIEENSDLFDDDDDEYLRESVARIDANINWRLKYEKRLDIWFSQNV